MSLPVDRKEAGCFPRSTRISTYFICLNRAVGAGQALKGASKPIPNFAKSGQIQPNPVKEIKEKPLDFLGFPWRLGSRQTRMLQKRQRASVQSSIFLISSSAQDRMVRAPQMARLKATMLASDLSSPSVKGAFPSIISKNARATSGRRCDIAKYGTRKPATMRPIETLLNQVALSLIRSFSAVFPI